MRNFIRWLKDDVDWIEIWLGAVMGIAGIMLAFFIALFMTQLGGLMGKVLGYE